MQLDRFTEKAQEAIVTAQQLAERAQSPVLDAEHLLAALVAPDDGIPAETLRRLGADLPGVPRRARRHPRPARPDAGRPADARPAREAGHRACPGGGAPPRRRVHLHRAPAPRHGRGGRRGPAAARAARRHGRGDPRCAPDRPRRPAGHLGDARGHVPGAREVRARPHRRGPCRQARPGHRPGRGDPAHGPGPQPPDEEQPGAHRRARRRQDGDRRGPRPADRPRRRPRDAQGQAGHRSRPGLRSSQAPSSGASSRSG